MLCIHVFLRVPHSENGPQITYVRDFKAKVQYFRFWCQVCQPTINLPHMVLRYIKICYLLYGKWMQQFKVSVLNISIHHDLLLVCNAAEA